MDFLDTGLSTRSGLQTGNRRKGNSSGDPSRGRAAAGAAKPRPEVGRSGLAAEERTFGVREEWKRAEERECHATVGSQAREEFDENSISGRLACQLHWGKKKREAVSFAWQGLRLSSRGAVCGRQTVEQRLRRKDKPRSKVLQGSACLSAALASEVTVSEARPWGLPHLISQEDID
jgi:hypothetical protein